MHFYQACSTLRNHLHKEYVLTLTKQVLDSLSDAATLTLIYKHHNPTSQESSESRQSPSEVSLTTTCCDGAESNHSLWDYFVTQTEEEERPHRQ